MPASLPRKEREQRERGTILLVLWRYKWAQQRKGGDTMIFLSTLLRQNVCDLEGRRLGTLKDVCVSLNEAFPVVTALVVSQSSLTHSDLIIPWSQVDNLEAELKIQLTVQQAQLVSYNPHPEEILLKRDILDKQIVDTQGFRVVKVNDLKLAQIKNTARLIGVDISLSGLLRRLGAAWLTREIGRASCRERV